MIDITAKLSKALTKVTADFTKEKRRAAGRQSDYCTPEQYDRWENNHILKPQICKAAYEVMEKAYLQASDNNTLPANARQIMYAARPLILQKTGDKIWKNDSYFTQTLLPDYIESHFKATADWDVVYDARGHLTEPHVKESLGLGTLNVRNYIGKWDNEVSGEIDAGDFSAGDFYPTKGPLNRYKYALFIEKEGFDALLEKSEIAKKYDLAIFSSKGMSTTATRTLVEALSNHGVTILIVHDFDKSGLGIVHNLYHDTRRYQFAQEPNVIDLGLRLDDVQELGLSAEPCEYLQHKNPADILREYGASQAERDFLVTGRAGYKGWAGQRVELNALTARQFISWLSDKLDQHGVKKVIPDAETLKIAFACAEKVFKIKQALEDICKEDSDKLPVPKNLQHLIEAQFVKDSTVSWDIALQDIVAEMLD
jgi:hypothetical protein